MFRGFNERDLTGSHVTHFFAIFFSRADERYVFLCLLKIGMGAGKILLHLGSPQKERCLWAKKSFNGKSEECFYYGYLMNVKLLFGRTENSWERGREREWDLLPIGLGVEALCHPSKDVWMKGKRAQFVFSWNWMKSQKSYFPKIFLWRVSSFMRSWMYEISEIVHISDTPSMCIFCQAGRGGQSHVCWGRVSGQPRLPDRPDSWTAGRPGTDGLFTASVWLATPFRIAVLCFFKIMCVNGGKKSFPRYFLTWRQAQKLVVFSKIALLKEKDFRGRNLLTVTHFWEWHREKNKLWQFDTSCDLIRIYWKEKNSWTKNGSVSKILSINLSVSTETKSLFSSSSTFWKEKEEKKIIHTSSCQKIQQTVANFFWMDTLQAEKTNEPS